MASVNTPLAGSPNSSLQVADAVIVSVDTRGFELARSLALQGWKTVVVELDGPAFNTEMEWADRLGPFLSWVNAGASSRRENYPAFWLPTGPVALAGKLGEAGKAHLQSRYGVSFEGEWPEALTRNLLSTRLSHREAYMKASDELSLAMDTEVSSEVDAEAIAKSRRESALAVGVRILQASQISAVRLSDGRVDRVEFMTKDGVLVERTRSLVWMLSEDESRRDEFTGSEVPLNQMLEGGQSEPLMAWWRTRLCVRGLKSSSFKALGRVPETPPAMIVVGSVERPWTHDNLLLLEQVEQTSEQKIFDVWTCIPYWARVDHVYRDEQRQHVQAVLADRFVGCELVWLTPSPLGLTEPAIRLPHVIYGEDSVAAKGRLRNICFAGPETWGGIGLLGLKSRESHWLSALDGMRVQWDPVARLKASRIERAKYAIKKALRRKQNSDAPVDKEVEKEML